MSYTGPERRRGDRKALYAYLLILVAFAFSMWRVEQTQNALLEERYRSIRAVCEAINDERRILRGIVIEATEPEPGETPPQIANSLTLRDFALEQLTELKCGEVLAGGDGNPETP